MDHAKNKERIVREAAALMGQRELAEQLGVRVDDVSSWADGSAVVPDSILAALSEILLSWSGKQNFT